MTLEDFFTLTEMKDGLTALARVKELVTVMQQEKDCSLKNVGEATRQWSTVASTITATENKDCLDLFIQLDGLWFIDKWLRDAQRFGNDTGDSFVDESVTALLQAIEKLHIDSAKSVSSGIWLTVKNLIGHNNSRIQNRARALFDSWKQDRESDALPQDAENVEALLRNETKESTNVAGENRDPECSSRDISLSRGSSDEEKLVKPAGDNIMALTYSDALQSERVDDVQTSNFNRTLEQGSMKSGPLDPAGSSVMSNPVNENPLIKDDCPINCSEDSTSIQTRISAAPKQDPFEGQSNDPELNEYANDAKQMPKMRNSPERVCLMETKPTEHKTLSPSGDAANSMEPLTEPGLQKNSDNDKKYPHPGAPLDDVGIVISEGKSGMDNSRSPNHCESGLVFRTSDQDRECSIDVFQVSSVNKQKLEKSDCSNSGAVDEDKTSSTDESEYGLANDTGFSKPKMNAKDSDVIVRSSDIELDYGIVDPLDVARQVAIEVEREVIDCRERSCSSSKKMSGGIREPDSPDSINEKQSQPVEGPPKDVSSGPNLSAEDSPIGEGPLISTGNLDAKPINSIQDMESSHITQAAQESEANAEKSSCDFDLNQEVSSDNTDCQLNTISAPVSVVSASRATAPPGFPFTSLQFDGTLGWKGSAANSAFRPASPRPSNEGDKAQSTGGSCNDSRQRLDFLDIDLNVAECGDDKTTYLLPGKPIQVSSGFPSGESSLEANPIRSERLKLDLNHVSDDFDAPLDWRIERWLFHHPNGHQSPSPSSSLQPTMKNIDLNDQPYFLNDSADHPYFAKSLQNLNTFGQLKPDGCAISILGTRVEVNRKDFVSQSVSLPNGRIPEPARNVNLPRSGGVSSMGSAVPRVLSPVYRYNGHISRPTMPFSSSTMCGPGGPIPYTVDSRGAPVIPQMVTSASTLLPAFPQSPFIMSMTGAPASNGVDASRHNFDLNSGSMIEGGNRDSRGLGLPLNPAQGWSMDEHSRVSSQPSSSSGVGLKRKEPDGLDFYPFNFKRQPPPWR